MINRTSLKEVLQKGLILTFLRSSFLQAEAEQQPQETYEIEQWLVDFANLFRDALGVEPDKHLDLTNFGWEKLQSALDSAVLSDEAPKLFDKAADRFQEVTAHGAFFLTR